MFSLDGPSFDFESALGMYPGATIVKTCLTDRPIKGVWMLPSPVNPSPEYTYATHCLGIQGLAVLEEVGAPLPDDAATESYLIHFASLNLQYPTNAWDTAYVIEVHPDVGSGGGGGGGDDGKGSDDPVGGIPGGGSGGGSGGIPGGGDDPSEPRDPGAPPPPVVCTMLVCDPVGVENPVEVAEPSSWLLLLPFVVLAFTFGIARHVGRKGGGSQGWPDRK